MSTYYFFESASEGGATLLRLGFVLLEGDLLCIESTL